jgi:poly-beta-1,6-N-acetyl-D-glucosamine synthase
MNGAVLVFAASALFIVYTLFLYPLLLAVWAKVSARPPLRAFSPLPVTVLLPVYNGAAYLAEKLDSLLAMDYPETKMNILVLSDGSTDSTAEIAARFASRGVAFRQLPHGGKALALNAGLAEATGEILFFTDVRQRMEPLCLRRIVERFADPAVGAVSGELVIRDGATLAEASVGLYWKYEKWIRRRLSAIDSTIGATGCVWAIRRHLAKPMPAGCLLDDVFLPLQALFSGYRVVFEESARVYDIPSTLETEFKRKVRTLAGNYQLLFFQPQLLGPSNRLWLHFVSHKLARLLLPFALLTALAAAPFLPEPWNLWALCPQVLFYLTASLDLAVPEGSPMKRLTSPCRTFVVLMAASFCAASILFRPKARFWVPSRPV